MASSVDRGHGAAYAGSQSVFAGDTIGGFGNPWEWAGALEKVEAVAIVRVYLDQERVSGHELAGMFGTSLARVLNARWLATASGLITRMADQTYRPTYEGKKATERGSGGHGL